MFVPIALGMPRAMDKIQTSEAPRYVGYSEQQEIAADYMAVPFLAAADIPPDRLFDAMAKLSSPGPRQSERPQWSGGYSKAGTTRNATRKTLGKMLDAGQAAIGGEMNSRERYTK